jgi:trk system potassium uptake protein TrkH
LTTTAEAPVGRSARLGVDVSASLNLVGSLVKYLGPSALVPTAFALTHSEPTWPFLAAGALVSGFGLALERVTRGAEEVGIREGYLVVTVTWLVAAAYGALPYILANDPQLGRPVDALFEGMSGFTTTGASAATDVAALPVSIQVWRQLTIWLGGIGVVALGLAVLPRLRVGGRQLLESELAGPEVEALSGRIRDTVRRFALLYLGLTAAGFLALALPGWAGAHRVMNTYQAFAHTLSTLGTGSFSTERGSIGAFGPLTQWTIVVFMIVAGTNFLVLYRALVQRRPREAAREEELRLYFAILVVAAAAVVAIVWSRGVEHGEAAVRAGVFEVTSVVTTTGYFTVDYGHWPLFALMTLALLFFVGGCAGSTAGSIKIVRHLLIARLLGREVVRTVHPELVRPVRLNGVVVDQQALLAVISFVLIYVAVFLLGTGVLALEAAFRGPHMDVLDLVFASGSTLGNAGVGLGPAGTTGSFAAFGDPSTVAMTVLMWAGRLEILPVVVLLRRSYWRL